MISKKLVTNISNAAAVQTPFKILSGPELVEYNRLIADFRHLGTLRTADAIDAQIRKIAARTSIFCQIAERESLSGIGVDEKGNTDLTNCVPIMYNVSDRYELTEE